MYNLHSSNYSSISFISWNKWDPFICNWLVHLRTSLHSIAWCQMLSLVPIVTQRNEIINNMKIYTYVKKKLLYKKVFYSLRKEKARLDKSYTTTLRKGMTMQYQLPKICRIKFQFQKKKMNEWVNEWKSFVNTQRFVGSWLGFRTGNAPCPHLCCQSHWGYPDISQNETHSNRAARTVQCLCICGLFCINKLDFDFFWSWKLKWQFILEAAVLNFFF